MKEYSETMSTNLIKKVMLYKCYKHMNSKEYTILILFTDEINETTGVLAELSSN